MQIDEGPEFKTEDIQKVVKEAQEAVYIFTKKVNRQLSIPSKDNLTEAMTAASDACHAISKQFQAVDHISKIVAKQMFMLSVLIENLKEN